MSRRISMQALSHGNLPFVTRKMLHRAPVNIVTKINRLSDALGVFSVRRLNNTCGKTLVSWYEVRES